MTNARNVRLIIISTFIVFICFNFLSSNVTLKKFIKITPRITKLGDWNHSLSLELIQLKSTPGPGGQESCKPNSLNPPRLTDDERTALSQLKTPSEALSALSSIVRQQIIRTNSRNCSEGMKVLCGHFDGGCGFGCQFHHRVACVMISYALNIPLIHDSQTGWSYSTPWDDIFEPLGSNCIPDHQTYVWTWDQTFEYYIRQSNKASYDEAAFIWYPCNDSFASLDYPLIKGIVADEEIANYVAKFTSKPYKWWVGQFISYGFRLNSATVDKLKRDKAAIGLSSSCIGLQIRRTDKVNEDKDSFHNLTEYFDILYKRNSFMNMTHSLPQVYLASDEPKVFQEAMEKYSDLKILGYPMKPGYNRKDTLYPLIRDISLLLTCEHVICGLTSNICRLIYEMLNYVDHLNVNKRLTSLDGEYVFYLINHIISPVINRISKF